MKMGIEKATFNRHTALHGGTRLLLCRLITDACGTPDLMVLRAGISQRSSGAISNPRSVAEGKLFPRHRASKGHYALSPAFTDRLTGLHHRSTAENQAFHALSSFVVDRYRRGVEFSDLQYLILKSWNSPFQSSHFTSRVRTCAPGGP
jgi:hypothetical protein